MHIVACDVGQGDATLISYDRLHILVDTGPKNDVLACLRQEIFWGDPTIDALVLTHEDHDHIGGVESVLDHYHVKLLVANETTLQSLPQEYLTQIKSVVPTVGDSMTAAGFRLRIVWSESTRLKSNKNLKPDGNQDSVGLYLSYPIFGFLTLGDLECTQELAVAYMGVLNKVDFIKLSHHGAKTSTCAQFLQKINPEAAFVSVGKDNSYGHPASTVLKDLESLGIYLWRTDSNGLLHWQFVNQKLVVKE